MSYDYDLLVIGAGSGGVRAARMSAGYGARVAVVESTYLGGTCVNVGCVPKKLFVYGSHYREDFEDAAAYGWDVADTDFHWPRLRDNKTREIERLNGVYRQLLDSASVDIKLGRARLVDPHTVLVEGGKYTAQNVLVATGSWPRLPDIQGIEHAITSNEAFYLEQFPKRVAVIGGGYIAVEFAGIFNGLGAGTELLYRGPMFLRGFDDSVRHFVAGQLEGKGINLRFETTVEGIERIADRKILHLNDGSVLETDLVLYAIGRTPNVSGLGLEEIGVALNARGAIEVDEFYRTSVPGIYALGDVIDRFQLTPVAIAEAMCFAANLFSGGEPRVLDYQDIPTAVFCQPNIGTVGPTEAEAAALYPNLQVYESEFRPLKHTLSGRDERTLMKLLVNADDDRVIAAHMVGPEAGEIIQGLAVAITAGATKAEFDRTVGIHPTAAEEFVTMRVPVR